jgi:AraC-like DNA-binding protein
MNYNISDPSSVLARYIKHYWRLESCVPKGQQHIQRIVPNGLFELIFYLENKPKASDDRKSINDRIIVTGQLANHHDLIVTGNVSLFAIYFLPQGLSAFLNLPVNELFNQSVPLKFILKDNISRLEDELSEAQSFQEQVTVAERFLIHLLQKNQEQYNNRRITHTINRINETKGILKINDMASDAFLSRKQFERTFTGVIGTSPKQFLKIVRFQNAIYERSQNTRLSLTEIAYKCGYFDQAHMINDFKNLSGISPGKFFAEEHLVSDYFGV